MKMKHVGLLALLVALAFPASWAHAQKIRVGYWTSGVSLGFGSTIEQMKFLEKQGLDVEWIKFADVNGPTKGLVSDSIDVAFGASTAGALSTAADGVPIRVFLTTQIAAVDFVVLESSPIKSLAELKGKKVGMSPPGSATHSLAIALLEGNYGLKSADFTAVPGNEPRLAQFLVQGEIQAAALRGTTVAQLNEVKLRKLGNYVDEWKKLTKSSSVPVIGVGAIRTDYLAKNPEAVVKFIVGFKEATDWGGRNKPRVAEILQKVANMNAEDAAAYAGEWNAIYKASLENEDVTMLKRMGEMFRQAGTIKNPIPDSAFVTDPYVKAKPRFTK